MTEMSKNGVYHLVVRSVGTHVLRGIHARGTDVGSDDGRLVQDVHLGPLLLTLLVCSTSAFLWWKIHQMERTVKRVIGILIANGWSLNDGDNPGSNTGIKTPKS
jgi:hypothetical protein